MSDAHERIAVLEAALKPFADEAAELPTDLTNDATYWHCLDSTDGPDDLVRSDFTVGDLRRARNVLGGSDERG